MPADDTYDYAVIRVVPRVEREEFINVGIIVSREHPPRVLARIDVDEPRLRALAPELDLEPVRRHLDAIVRLCEGPCDAGALTDLSPRERFHWLTAQRSAVIQTSAIHMGRARDLDAAAEHLMDRMVRRPRPAAID